MDIERIGREQVATLQELLDAGVTRAAVNHRRKRHWQEPLPRVFVLHTGPLTWRQRFHAALCHAGSGAQLTSVAVLALHGLRDAPEPARVAEVEVLLPVPRKRRSMSFVKVRRTRTMPPRTVDVDGFPCAPLPWALADACAAAVRAGEPVRKGCLYEAVQRRRVGVEQLRETFLRRQVPLTGELGAVLADLEAGAHSVAEGWGRRLVARSGLPQPLWNRALRIDGRFLCRPDAYWPEHGVVLEVDSVRHHQVGEDFTRTVTRQALLASAGLCVIPATPTQLRTRPDTALARLAEALSRAPYPGVGRVRVG
ncbi:hypothetical protein [Streptomyces sp. UH6]|uniref:hypothetical protein n=1 Tax=Streptomyces sp. UH6 TaxID=2748379 RepID=UPI0015D51103|nr:hypothetical protein [Streptomyces sp. UH6]NYV74483.1 hypothetical protein [Streptomyces sp. UH6]